MTTINRVTPINRSGTIASGGTAQTLAQANPSRHGYSIQNQSAGDLYFRHDGVAATADKLSIKLPAGDLFETPPGVSPVGAISIIGATTAQAFFAEEW
jgi:hypothetical protein